MSAENNVPPTKEQEPETRINQEDEAPTFDPINEVKPKNITQVESLCLECHKNGTTTLLFTSIPHFREIIVSSFFCPHCGNKNTEIQYGGSFNEVGYVYELEVKNEKDLNRQLVKSEWATLNIPQLDFEIPAATQPSLLTNVEGILRRAVEGLSEKQPLRKIMNPEAYEKIEEIISKLNDCLAVKQPFEIRIDDPSGNSNIEKYQFPNDPQLKVKTYKRTKEQDQFLGVFQPLTDAEFEEAERRRKAEEAGIPLPETDAEAEAKADAEYAKNNPEVEHHGQKIMSSEDLARFTARMIGHDAHGQEREMVIFSEKCPSCSKIGDLRMLMTNIPFFKEIIVYGFMCTNCGYKSNEIRAAGGISEKGRRINLTVSEPAIDLSRDILKSETASLEIPEIELRLEPGTLGGKFTTIEGMVDSIIEALKNIHHFRLGDSAVESEKQKMLKFLAELEKFKTVEKPFHIVIDDPLANSYVQNVYAPDPDPNLIVEDYERTHEQNEELGLYDINV